MQILAPFIVQSALRWLDRSCRETSKNGGGCIDDIHKQYAHYSPQNDKWKREAYCAKLGYVIVAEAAAEAQAENWLPPNPLAVGMLNAAKKDRRFPTNTTPGIGSVFYRLSTAAGASGHIGVIIGVDNGNFYSVEGNASIGSGQEGVGFFTIPRVDIPRRSFQFMHVGNAPTARAWPGNVPNIRALNAPATTESSVLPAVLALAGISSLLYISSR